LARGVANPTAAPIEKSLKAATWLADEKSSYQPPRCSGSCRGAGVNHRCSIAADQILMSAVISSALPHVINLFVARERPDRIVPHGFRHGVPRSGNPWDSFPSRHVLHLGPLAAAGSQYGEKAFPAHQPAVRQRWRRRACSFWRITSPTFSAVSRLGFCRPYREASTPLFPS
jgi:hypothetical protein